MSSILFRTATSNTQSFARRSLGRLPTLLAASVIAPFAPPAPQAAQAQTCYTWQDRAPATPPSGRSRFGMVYDTSRNVIVLFGGGGTGTNTALGDTWELSNAVPWTNRGVTGPLPRTGPAMAFDSARNVTVLFGGRNPNLSTNYGDTWEWNGTTWTQRAITGPAAGDQYAMAFDSARGVTVLYGSNASCNSSGTWEWNGTTWTQRGLPIDGFAPGCKVLHSMAYDAARGVTVMVGGYLAPATWEWDGTTWTNRTGTGPSFLDSTALAYDSIRGRVVCSGGSVNTGMGIFRYPHTWEWDGTAWTQRISGVAGGTEDRADHRMIFDPDRGVCVVFGGTTSAGGFHNTTIEYPWVAPAITMNPTSQSACPGASVMLTCAATGTLPVYQWRKNSVDIPGANTTTYSIPSFTGADAASYTCFVSNSCGNATTAAAVLTANAAPSITSQPGNQTVCPGNNTTISLAASGTPSPTYQWRKNGTNIGGATNSSLTLTSVTTGDAGSYDCLVSNACGTTGSAAATLTVHTATAITTQPTPQAACLGAPATFSLVAVGTNLTYQWYHAAALIPGATASSYTIASVVLSDAGNYSCRVMGTCIALVVSNSVALTINTGPSFTFQPPSQTLCAGGTAVFTVIAAGTAPLTYQWRKDGANLSGATSPSLSIPSLTVANSGSYDCIVSNPCGNATCNPAILTVNPQTAITMQPASQAVCTGGTATFTVTATGGGTLTYQWRKSGANISGATALSYSISSVAPSDASVYDCRVFSTSCSTVTTAAATLTVNTAPAITTHPVSQTVCAGASVSLSVVATGSPAPTYQWRKNGVNMPGVTTAGVTLGSVNAASTGNYDCVVTNVCGMITSSAAVVTVNAATTIASQPTAQSACLGAGAAFSLAAGGTGPFTYQWRKGGVNIAGATGASHTIASATAGDAATYDCIVMGACGSATSNGATLTVNAAPTITTQPSPQAVCDGANATFTVAASSFQTPMYQWRKNGVNISGATSASLTLIGVTAPAAGNYTCVVTNPCGNPTSNAATLTVYAPPGITTQPMSQSVCVGAPVTFSIIPTGQPAVFLQWKKNGVNIAGATGTSYTIPSAAAADNGSYTCTVTTTCGSATSSAATLIVGPTLSITTQPTNQSAAIGGLASFTVAVSGSLPSYQWRKNSVDLTNGGAISGANAATLTISPVALTDAGSYDVAIRSSCGSATSTAATLTVNACVADVDDGTGSGVPDGGVTIEDLLYYLNIFDQGLPSADVDDGTATGTPDGGVTIEDLLYYLFRFDSGC